MQDPKAKEERPISAREQAERRRDIDLREILGMRRLWVVNADGKRQEPKPADE
jgi:hypothetical protein